MKKLYLPTLTLSTKLIGPAKSENTKVREKLPDRILLVKMKHGSSSNTIVKK